MADVVSPEELGFDENNQEASEQILPQEANFVDGLRMEDFLATSKQNREERKKYAEWLFTFVVIWSLFIYIAVIATGKGFLKLSDTVVVSLITTAMANVISLFIIVTKYLFNPTKST